MKKIHASWFPIVVSVAKVDWKLLRKQKRWLTRVAFATKPHAEAEGLLALLDDIQDQAARILGDEIVFGKKPGQKFRLRKLEQPVTDPQEG